MSITTSISSKILLSVVKRTHHLSSFSSYRPFSSSTPYPLYYELIHHRPPPRSRTRSKPDNPQAESEPDMDRSKRKYYRKRARRMFGGSDSDSDKKSAEEFVELKPEIVDFPRLHAREQELYFYDAFAFPWEKEKHYRMVYQLEKKYFPQQSLNKAFVDDPGEEPVGNMENERGLVFFDEGEERGVKEEKKVKEFFKCLKKFPSGGGGGKRRDVSVGAAAEVGGEPFLVSRRTELPPRWDGPAGTMVLVDKPKG